MNFNLISNEHLFAQIKALIHSAKNNITILQSDYNVFINETTALSKLIKQELKSKKNNNPHISIDIVFIQGIDSDSSAKNIDINNDFCIKYKTSFLKTVISKAFKLDFNTNIDNKIKEISIKEVENALEEIKYELIEKIQDIQESYYYQNETKQKSEQSITNIINSIKNSIIISKNEDNTRIIIKSILKFFVDIVDGLVDLKNISSLVKKNAIIFLADVLHKTYLNTIAYKNFRNNQYYYDFAFPLLEVIASDLYPTLAFCNEKFLSDILIVDNKNILDFSSYLDLPQYSLYRNSFYKISLDKEMDISFRDFFDGINGIKFGSSNVDILFSNQHNPYLKHSIQENIHNLNYFFYAEYPELNSILLTEMILDKNKMQRNSQSTRIGKNYLFITNPPSLINAGLCENIYKKLLKAKILNQPKPPSKADKLALKDNKFPTKRDYSAYIIQKNTNESQHYVLQLCPFVKIDGEYYETYGKYYKSSYSSKELLFLNQYSSRQIYKEKYEKEINNNTYLHNFFRLPKEIESIGEKEQKNVETYIEAFQTYLEGLNKYELFSKTRYCYLQILFISLSIYVIRKEFDLTVDCYIRSYQYQSINIPNYQKKLNVISSNSYIISENNKKIKLLLTKNLNLDKFNNEVLYLDELAEKIFENNLLEDKQSYIDFLKALDMDEAKDIQDKTEITKSLQEILADNELAKIAIDISFFTIIKQFFPFTAFFESYPECFYKFVMFFIKVNFNEQGLLNGFRKAIIEEMGAFASISPSGIFSEVNSKTRLKNIQSIPNKKKFLYATAKGYYYFIKEVKQIKGLEKSRSFSRLDISLQANMIFKVKKQLAFDFSKQALSSLGADLTKEFLKSFIDMLIPTHYDSLKKQYDNFLYEKFTYNFDAPLAVRKDTYMTYPMLVNSRFMSFDLYKFIFGSLLCTGGLTHYPSASCVITSAEAKDFAIKRLLSYIILDEKRGAISKSGIKREEKAMDDINFFENISNIDIFNAKIYEVKDEEKEKEYKNSTIKTRNTPILLYNQAIQIIYEYANNIHINTGYQKNPKDEQKARKLIKSLDSIGQYNLKIMYMGVNKENKEKSSSRTHNFSTKAPLLSGYRANENTVNTNPNFIGRLATVIIMENGLWIG